MKRIIIYLLSLLIVSLSVLGIVSALAPKPVSAMDDILPIEVEPILDMESSYANSDGSIVYQVINHQDIAEFLGVDPACDIVYTEYMKSPYYSTPENTRSMITISKTTTSTDTLACLSHSSLNQTDDTVSKVITLSTELLNSNTLSMASHDSIDHTVISAALGFDVSKSIKINERITRDLPPSQELSIKVFPRYKTYSYSVDIDHDYGIAREVIGVYTVTSITL